ncbi:MAG TPA: ion channel [Burkholderiales bacterium]|nr:ion channel [Burkholderiales bacterium]
MTTHGKSWFGLGGVPAHDNALAHLWEKRLHWPMIGVALLSIPALLLEDLTQMPRLHLVGKLLEVVIFLAFAGEFLWMMRLTSHRSEYAIGNWLDLLIILSSALDLAGWEFEWVAIARLLRLALVGLLLTRIVGSLRNMFSPSGIPFLIGFGLITLGLAGAGFYWIEPTVHSYADGVWLAFVTGSTVGYGDVVPTTTASRLFAGLMVLLGFTLFSLVTASIAAFFVGEDEKLLRKAMHDDIRKLHDEIAQLIGDEERSLRREMHTDIRQLRREVAEIRQSLGESARDNGPSR